MSRKIPKPVLRNTLRAQVARERGRGKSGAEKYPGQSERFRVGAAK